MESLFASHRPAEGVTAEPEDVAPALRPGFIPDDLTSLSKSALSAPGISNHEIVYGMSRDNNRAWWDNSHASGSAIGPRQSVSGNIYADASLRREPPHDPHESGFEIYQGGAFVTAKPSRTRKSVRGALKAASTAMSLNVCSIVPLDGCPNGVRRRPARLVGPARRSRLPHPATAHRPCAGVQVAHRPTDSRPPARRRGCILPARLPRQAARLMPNAQPSCKWTRRHHPFPVRPSRLSSPAEMAWHFANVAPARGPAARKPLAHGS